MDHTIENIQKTAEHIVDYMDMDDLISYVVDDLYSLMLEDKDLFDENVKSCGEPR